MKKTLIVLLILSLVSALFLVPASAKGTVVNLEIKGDNVAPRASDKLEVLYDGSILSDSDASANDFNKKGIVLIQNKNCASEDLTEVTIVFELDSVQSIDTVYINWYVYANAMIGLPHENSLIIGTSADGNAFHEDVYTMEGEIVNVTDPSFQLETVIRLNAAVDAKYVSISFSMGPNGQGWDKVSWEWIGLTEVGAGLQSEEGDDDYEEVSQEESIDIGDIEPIVEIPAGAKYIKHVPFNQSIVTDSNTIITDPTNLAAFNVAWSACVLLRPTEVEGEYSVVAVKAADGDYDFAFADVAEGDIALAVHGESTETTANRDALAALVEGDIVTFAGYNFEEQTFETGAVVYYAVPAETPDEPSQPEDESSEPADDSSEPADESSKPAEDESSSAPAVSEDDKSEEKGGNTGLIIGIVVAVVVVVAIVVVVVVVAKKKK
ncbi:MAG: hypothetical protein J6R40_02875 [Clostridia bacterium]|nr:hypothetical protein [Clostridia bacterium]